MAAVETTAIKRSLEDTETSEYSLSKRFKASELPLTATQKLAVDSLVHTIKKKGIYDKLRHQIFAQYSETVRSSHFLANTFAIADSDLALF